MTSTHSASKHSDNSSLSNAAVAGACSEGLITTQFPAASAEINGAMTS